MMSPVQDIVPVSMIFYVNFCSVRKWRHVVHLYTVIGGDQVARNTIPMSANVPPVCVQDMYTIVCQDENTSVLYFQNQ